MNMSPAVPLPPTAPGAGAAAPALNLLMNRVVLLPELQAEMTRLRRELETAAAPERVADLAVQLAALLNRQRALLQGEQAKMAGLLEMLNGRLDEIAGHLSHEDSQRQAASEDSTDLNSRLQGEVRDIGSSVREAGSLSQVQQQVTTRIARIGEQLQQFRQREQARLSDYQERADRLRSRVSELERETTQLQQSVQHEQQRASTDALTGIPNRLAFEQRAAQEMEHVDRSGEPLSVAMWDIDCFKSINDGCGHAAGDKVLRIFAQHLARNLRDSDFVARIGGEEFVVLFHATAVEDALAQAERAREGMRSFGLHFRGQAVNVTASCGLAAVAPGEALELTLNRADAALYQAKRSGRNRCLIG